MDGNAQWWKNRSRLTDTEDPQVHVRIIAVNDLYELENMARLKTCIDLYRVPNTIITVAGDFVAPSLQTAIDKGRGMVDVMNLCGVDYVCLGNHETQISWEDLKSRARESKFTWINSNMPGVELPSDIRPWPDHIIREFEGSHGKRIKLALLGLNTNNPCYYAGRTVFGGAQILDVNQTAKQWAEKLSGQVDAIVPLTHQKKAEDTDLAKLRLGFPVILGGHDHFLWHEIITDQHVIKLGQNADRFGIIDLIWRCDNPKPSVAVRVYDAGLFKPDPTVATAIRHHENCIAVLEHCILCPFPSNHQMSSKDVREKSTTMATFLADVLKKSWGADCCLLGSGFNRASVDYKGRQAFLYSDLVNELPMEIATAPFWVPGQVLIDTIIFSRTGPRWGTGAFLQTDSGIICEGYETVLKINGAPVDPNKKYYTVLQTQHLHGCDNLTPLLNWWNENKEQLNVGDEFFFPAQIMVIEYFSRLLLLQVAKFDAKSEMTRQELVESLSKQLTDPEAVEIMTNNMLALGDGQKITKTDFLEVLLELADFDAVDTNHDGQIDLTEARKYLAEKGLSDEEVVALFQEFDTDKNSTISKEEFRSFMCLITLSNSIDLVLLERETIIY